MSLLLSRSNVDRRFDLTRHAWRLLAAPERTRLPQAEFAARWRASRDERHAQEAALRSALAAAAPLEEWASVVFPDGQRVACGGKDQDDGSQGLHRLIPVGQFVQPAPWPTP